MAGYDYTFRVLLLGDPSSGKDEFFNRYLSRFFLEDLGRTIGVDFGFETQEFRGKKVKLQIWNYKVENRFRFILPQICSSANGVIIMYDITSLKSLDHLPDWTQIIRKQAGDIPVLLVGNNLDLEKYREIPKEEGILTTKKHNLSACVELSSKTGKNVENTFAILTKILMEYCFGKNLKLSSKTQKKT